MFFFYRKFNIFFLKKEEYLYLNVVLFFKRIVDDRSIQTFKTPSPWCKQRKMAVANQCLSYTRFVTVRGTQSSPLQRKPLLFSFTLPSRSQNLYSSIVTASSKKKNNKVISFSTILFQYNSMIHTSQLSNLYYAFFFFYFFRKN